VTSGGNNLNDFPEDQLTKFRAFYTVTGQWRQNVCQDSLRGKMKSQILEA